MVTCYLTHASFDRSSILLTGGQGTKFFTWEFDILTGDWLQRQSVPDGGRYSHACAYISRDDMHGLLITGGSNGQHLMSSTFFFDMSKGYWFRIAQADLPGRGESKFAQIPTY